MFLSVGQERFTKAHEACTDKHNLQHVRCTVLGLLSLSGMYTDVVCLYYQIWIVMWLRTALNDIFYSNSALSEFTELIFLVCWVSVAPQNIKHIESNRIDVEWFQIPAGVSLCQRSYMPDLH